MKRTIAFLKEHLDIQQQIVERANADIKDLDLDDLKEEQIDQREDAYAKIEEIEQCLKEVLENPLTLSLDKGDMVIIGNEECEKHKSSMLKLTLLFDEKKKWEKDDQKNI